MIRNETDRSWLLVTHPDHAHLAGEFADVWGNDTFVRPEPFTSVRHAVYHHDDGWLARDACPSLTKERKPEAFSRTLVGAYSAFEEIDLPSYLLVRKEATAAVAAQDVYAGILTSMHTYNLLTEQADASTIRPEHRSAYAAFLAEQLAWQQEAASRLGASADALQRGFEFLQCCDNLSLIVCSGYGQARNLRHSHPDKHGRRQVIHCRPMGPGAYALSPWPLSVSEVKLQLGHREVSKDATVNLDDFRRAFEQAPLIKSEIVLMAAD